MSANISFKPIGMIIRAIIEQDILVCAAIMANNPLWKHYNVSFDNAKRRLFDGFHQGAEILVADIEGKAAGFVWMARDGAFKRSGYVMLIGVDPSMQNQGIGEALMDAAESRMFEKSSDIFLLVSDFNTSARRFYTRRGYVQIGEIPGYILPGVSEKIYRKLK